MKKKYRSEPIKEETVKAEPVIPVVQVVPVVPTGPVMTLNEYLSKYHGQRILDSIITKWYRKKDPTNPEKTRDEWDIIANSFQNETEK